VVTQRAEALPAGGFIAVRSSPQMVWFVHLVWTVSCLALCSCTAVPADIGSRLLLDHDSQLRVNLGSVKIYIKAERFKALLA
jgi:hypothetical protein